MSILFVTCDVKPFVVGSAIAKVAKNSRINFDVVATDPSISKWYDAGFNVHGPSKLEALFTRDDYDVVVVGISSLASAGHALEENAAKMARSHGIPVVFIDDDFGCFNKHLLVPDLYLTINSLSEKLIREKHACANIAIVGDNAVGITPSNKAITSLEEIRAGGKKVALLYCHKNPQTEAAAEYALACLKKSPDFVLIPTLHPGSPPEFIERCKGRISEFQADHSNSVRYLEGVSSDHIATLADITFGTHGTGIRVACYSGQTPILAWSRDIGSLLKDDVGTTHYAISKVAIEITSNNIKPFSELLEEDKPLLAKRREFISSPPSFSAEAALEAILGILQPN